MPDTKPHRVRPARRAALALAAVLFVAACGADEVAAPPPPAPASAPVPDTAAPGATAPAVDEATVAWTGRVCEAVTPVVDTLSTPPPVRFTDPAATRDAYLAYIDSSLQQAEQAAQAVNAAGTPPVEGGDTLAANLREQVEVLKQDLAEARAQLEAVDPDSAAELGAAIAAVGNVLGSLGNTAQAVGEVSADPRLRAAFEQAPACDQLRTIGAAS
jgi:hypothetical protein